MNIKHRNPAVVVILTFITFGIYGIVWTVKTKREINSLGGTIPNAWLQIIPIANIYFFYRYAEDFSIFVKKDNSPILWFLLFVVIAPVAMILVQMELNTLANPVSSPAVPTSS